MMNSSSDWQQGSVYGLKPNTVYAIDISVYRLHPTGQVYENTDDTSTLVQPLQITTLPGEWTFVYLCVHEVFILL